jgi:hypothetical protein
MSKEAEEPKERYFLLSTSIQPKSAYIHHKIE